MQYQNQVFDFFVGSDFHLEQFSNQYMVNGQVDYKILDRILSNIIRPKSKYRNVTRKPICIIAGDVTRITPFYVNSNLTIPTDQIYKYFLEWVSKRFQKVIVIAGNHEYYSEVVSGKPKNMIEIKQQIRDWTKEYPKVVFLDDEVLVIDQIAIWGGTLWSLLPDSCRLALPIYVEDKMITTQQYNDLHKKSLASLIEAKYKYGDKTFVVVSHHAPTFQHFLPEYLTTSRRFLYATDLHHVMQDELVEYWIAGHTHQSTTLTINKTQFISNSGPEKVEYNPEFVLIINNGNSDKKFLFRIFKAVCSEQIPLIFTFDKKNVRKYIHDLECLKSSCEILLSRQVFGQREMLIEKQRECEGIIAQFQHYSNISFYSED